MFQTDQGGSGGKVGNEPPQLLEKFLNSHLLVFNSLLVQEHVVGRDEGDIQRILIDVNADRMGVHREEEVKG